MVEVTRCTEVTGRRFRFIDVPYTEIQRSEMYLARIQDAEAWEPPFTHTEMEEIPKDDPAYATSFLEETVVWRNFSPIPHPSAPAQVFAPLQAARSTVGDGKPIS